MSTESDSIFVRNFSIVLAGLAVIGVCAFILASLVSGRASDAQYSVAAVAERVAPVGQVNTSGEPIAAGGGVADSGGGTSAPAAAPSGEAMAEAGGGGDAAAPGKQVYDSLCASCHAQGIAGAPKFGDDDAWASRMDKGLEMLVSNAINGYVGENGVMPAKGGNPNLSDDEVRAAVEYMVDAVSAGNEAADTAPEEASTAEADAMPESESETDTGDDAADDAAGMVAAAEDTSAEDATADAAADSAAEGLDLARGKEVYDTACWLCHTPGAAGAPKFGDAGAWAPRVEKGMETLYDHAINGFMGSAGLMPPKGGRTDLSDEDVKAAVAYIVENSQ